MTSVVVRSAVESDSEGILNVHVNSIKELCSKTYPSEKIQYWSNRQCEEKYKRAISEQDPLSAVFVAEKGGKIVGFGHIRLPDSSRERVGEIKALYVSPDESGQGTGKRILDVMEKCAREMTGYSCRELYVCSTLNAVGFYEKCGFVLRGPIVHSVGDGVDLDCIKLSKELVPG